MLQEILKEVILPGMPEELKNRKMLPLAKGRFSEATGEIITQEGQILARFLRPLGNTEDDFHISCIYGEHNLLLWDLKKENLARGGKAELFYWENEFIIGIIKNKKLIKIIPVNSLQSRTSQQTRGKPEFKITEIEHRKNAELKKELAAKLELEPCYNTSEWKSVSLISD